MKKLEEFTSAISEYTTLINKVLLRNPPEEEPYKFVYTLSFKTNNSLYTANLLIKNFLQNPYNTDSIFLILRTIMSDAITYYYLLYKCNNNDDKFIENIEWLNSQHINYTLKNLSVFKAGYYEDEGRIEEMKEEMKVNYKKYFTEEGSLLFDRMKGVSGMVYEMANSNKVLNSFAIRAYGIYDIFSKYEHLGEFTYELIHRQFDEEKRERILGEIYEAIREIIYFQKSLMNDVLEEPKEIDAFEILSNKIVAIKIYE